MVLGFGVGVAEPAAVATASVSACAGTQFSPAESKGQSTLIDAQWEQVPPPLRGFHWDCAARYTVDTFSDAPNASLGYRLLFVGVDFATVTRVLDSFGRSTWSKGPSVVDQIDRGTGEVEHPESLTIDQVRSLTAPPEYLSSIFNVGSSTA